MCGIVRACSDGGRRHKCELCNRAYSRPVYLREHMRTVHGEGGGEGEGGVKREGGGDPSGGARSDNKREVICHECGKRYGNVLNRRTAIY